MVIDDILETYYKYRQNVLEKYENPKHMQVVIKMKPKTFLEITNDKEVKIFNNGIFYYIELLGRKTPIIIKNDLPENIEFIMQSRREYEREEQQELFNKFYKIFGD